MWVTQDTPDRELTQMLDTDLGLVIFVFCLFVHLFFLLLEK